MQLFCKQYLRLTEKQQQGVALITVLFLLALATVIMAGLVTFNNANIQRSQAVIETEQAALLCLSGEEWARQFLSEDYKLDQNVDHLHEKWAEDGKILEIDNGYIEISIVDAEGKFNINNLVDDAGVTNPLYKPAFQRFLDLSLHDQQISATLAEQAADWIDADSSGIEDTDYLSSSIPYRPANTRITDPSELRWLKDMDTKHYASIYHDLFPYLVALPGKATPVNINTVSPEVVAAIANVSLQEAESMVRQIRSMPNGSAVPANMMQISPQPTTFSEYFEVRIRSKFGEHYGFMSSIIFRDHSTGQLSIVSRDHSTRFIFPFSKDYKKDGKSKDYEIDI